MENNIGETKRMGLFTYTKLSENEYEMCLDVPIKLTKKRQKEFSEYVSDIFGEDSQFQIIEEECMAPKKFIIKKIK